MTIDEAIYRLKDHFEVHNDNRPTPLLDEAAAMAYQALNNQKWLRDTLIDYEKDPAAVKGQAIMNDIYKVFVFNNNSFIVTIPTDKISRPTGLKSEFFIIDEEVINAHK